ncbi:MAG: ATP-binding cassette domain-containing protein, partial [Clostridia bacterium]|nr:ATP-binding cassette domain-containing protein [Clostridia bacterium]
MSEENNVIALKGSGRYFSANDTDAYRVRSGAVLVFIVPEEKFGEGRKSLIYEAGEGEIVPSFRCVDRDSKKWSFCLTALESAELEVIEYGSTKKLRDGFAEKIKLKNYGIEGFNSGLIERYKANILKEDILIKRTSKLKSSTFLETLKAVADSFKKKKIDLDFEESGNALYDCVSLVCAKNSIDIASYDRMKEACGGSDFNISDIARISYFSYRKITLAPGWEKNDSGAFVVKTNSGRWLACLPGRYKLTTGTTSYVLYDPKERSVVPLTGRLAQTISPDAYMVYRPLPHDSITKKDVYEFCKKSVSKTDVIPFVILVIITAIVGLVTPEVNNKLYDTYIPQGEKGMLMQMLLLLTSIMLANIMISVVKSLCNFRIVSKITYDMGNAVYDRVFNLPESFFRKFDSADLTYRVMSINNIISSSASTVITCVVSLTVMVIFLVRMLIYSAKMTVIGLLMLAVFIAVYYVIHRLTIKYVEEAERLNSETSSKLFQFIKGISKIRIAGVEDRALLEYLRPYIRLREKNEKSGKIALVNNAVKSLAGTLFMVVFYIVVVKAKGFSFGGFMAFMTLFGQFEANAMTIALDLMQFRALKPSFKRFEPIMEQKPEYNEKCELPGDITGAIEINNVTFAYSKDEPNVLTNFSLNINPGDYIGIVGASGSGKSTLIKLLLGFEKPASGKIYYDNKDIEKLDKKELRKKIGVVLQNGKLVGGSILDNIKITA